MPSLVAAPAESVVYSPDGYTSFTVRRLTDYALDRFAPHVSGLVVSTYSNQFEHTQDNQPDLHHPLSPGSVAAKFGSREAIENQEILLRTRLADNGNYWYVSERGSPWYSLLSFSLIALANTTLSKDGARQKLGWSPANCYLGNVLIRPQDQRSDERKMRYGAAVTHASIKFGGFDPQRLVVADVHLANPAAVAFFENAGLTPEDKPVSTMKFRNHQKLTMARYSGIIAHVIGTMEDRWPMLAAASSRYNQE